MKIKKLTPLDLAARNLFKSHVGNDSTYKTVLSHDNLPMDVFEKQIIKDSEVKNKK